MPKTKYSKRKINGRDYFYFRLRHKNLSNYKDIYAPTVKELEEKISYIRNKLENNIINTSDSFLNFFEDWLFDVKFLEIKPSTKELYEGLYRNYIKPSNLAKIKIKNLKLSDIQSYYNKLYQNSTSISLIKKINKLIAPCIRYAYDNNILIKDFSHSIKLPKEDEHTKLNKTDKKSPFSLEEEKIFLKAIKGHDLEMLFITALNTGLREGEILALTWSDINFDQKYISVNKAIKAVTEVSREGRHNYKIILQTPKTKNSIRTVPIPNELVTKLKEYKFKQFQQIQLLQNMYNNNNLVFCSTAGTYLNDSNIRKRLNKIIASINTNNNYFISHKTFHDFRHTYATRLFELNVPAKTVQALLGHSDISITLNTYTHVLENVKEETVSKLDDLYKKLGG